MPKVLELIPDMIFHHSRKSGCLYFSFHNHKILMEHYPITRLTEWHPAVLTMLEQIGVVVQLFVVDNMQAQTLASTLPALARSESKEGVIVHSGGTAVVR